MSAGRVLRAVRRVSASSLLTTTAPRVMPVAAVKFDRRFMSATTGAGKTISASEHAAYSKSTGGLVSDILKTKGTSFYYCRADDTVFKAIQEMVSHNIGSLVVVEPHTTVGKWKPVGIITERDYMEKGIVLGRHSKETFVKDIMSQKGLISVKPEAQLYNCMELMTEKHIRHIPVVDDTETLVGMISIGDVVREMVNTHKKEMAEMASFVSGNIY